MNKKVLLLSILLGLIGMVASFVAGMVLFRPEPITVVVRETVPAERPSDGDDEVTLAGALAAGIVAPRKAPQVANAQESISPVGERSLTLALEEAGQLPELTPRTADIQRTETLVTAWKDTGPEDRELRTAIITELRIRQMPEARTFAEEMIESDAPADRFVASAQLRTLGDPEAVEALETALAVESDPRAELMEAYALSRLDDQSLSQDTQDRIDDVVPQEWQDQDALERGGYFDLSVLDGTELEELKPEFAWWSGELSRAALVEREVEAARAESAESAGGVE